MKSSSRLTAYSIDPIERNLGRIILDISGHNLAEPDVQISSPKVLWGAPFEIFQSIQNHSSNAIELKLGRMIQDITPHNRSESNFPVFPRGRCWGAPFLKFSNRFKD